MPSGIFRSLTDGEYQQLIDAVPLIAILIAGADGNINLKEKEWSQKIVKIRSYSFEYELKPIYQELDKNYINKFESFLNSLPTDHIQRSEVISNKLSELNKILPKINIRNAAQLYNTYLSFAEEVAESCGGFLRMFAVSNEENLWLGLPMLDPIFYDDLEEEE
ncbi:MAG: hypothetical protein WAS56_01705 [Saprospiraceae bacterium]|jgi:hypothetical protein|nr:hypothetical protein [Saprospiraceae bacterium]